MPLILTDRRPGYLAVDAAGALVRVEYALNAAMWADADALLAWLDARPAEQAARLDRPGVRVEEITLDLTGTTLSDLPRTATTRPTTTESTPERSLFA